MWESRSHSNALIRFFYANLQASIQVPTCVCEFETREMNIFGDFRCCLRSMMFNVYVLLQWLAFFRPTFPVITFSNYSRLFPFCLSASTLWWWWLLLSSKIRTFLLSTKIFVASQTQLVELENEPQRMTKIFVI